jgi:hypothetical protein
MLKRLYGTLLLTALILGAVVWILSTSRFYEACVYQGHHDAGDALKQGLPALFGALKIYRHCAGAYLIENNAAITAIGTLIIATFTAILGIFTVSLARSTRIAADAAKRSSDAAIDLEVPRLSVSNISIQRASSLTLTPPKLATLYIATSALKTSARLQLSSTSFAPICDFLNARPKPPNISRSLQPAK